MVIRILQSVGRVGLSCVYYTVTVDGYNGSDRIGLLFYKYTSLQNTWRYQTCAYTGVSQKYIQTIRPNRVCPNVSNATRAYAPVIRKQGSTSSQNSLYEILHGGETLAQRPVSRRRSNTHTYIQPSLFSGQTTRTQWSSRGRKTNCPVKGTARSSYLCNSTAGVANGRPARSAETVHATNTYAHTEALCPVGV